MFSRTLPFPEPLVHSSASGVAEMAACLVLAPAEVIKQNAQMLKDDGGKTGLTSLQALRQLSGAGATRRLFMGYSALVARNLPFTALQFPMFEYARKKIRESRQGGQDGTTAKRLVETGLVTGLSAGSAGAVAAVITTPSDVVKTRMMLSAGSQNDVQAKIEGKRPKKGAWSVTQEVYRERGIKGFFRGSVLRSGWTMLGSGLYLGTYEVAKEWLKQEDKTGL